MTGPSDRDWVEDFTHENGNYMCHCVPCKKFFYGHKRRHCCKLCSEIEKVRQQNLTEEQRQIELEEMNEFLSKYMERIKNESI